MSKLRISDKRLANKRFRKTEEVILRIFFESSDYISARRIAKKAGIARSTFYEHHGAVREIIPDYEEYVLGKYKHMIKRVSGKKGISVSQLFTMTMYFMMIHKKFFIMFSKFDNCRIVMKMIEVLKETIIKEAKLTHDKERIFQIYAGEVEVLMWEWCQGGFDQVKVDEAVANIVYLMRTANMRLGVLK